MKTITLEVGRLLCIPLREFLELCKFKGMNISFHESSGILERAFTIKGEDSDMVKLKRVLDSWMREVNEC